MRKWVAGIRQIPHAGMGAPPKWSTPWGRLMNRQWGIACPTAKERLRVQRIIWNKPVKAAP